MKSVAIKYKTQRFCSTTTKMSPVNPNNRIAMIKTARESPNTFPPFSKTCVEDIIAAFLQLTINPKIIQAE